MVIGYLYNVFSKSGGPYCVWFKEMSLGENDRLSELMKNLVTCIPKCFPICPTYPYVNQKNKYKISYRHIETTKYAFTTNIQNATCLTYTSIYGHGFLQN